MAAFATPKELSGMIAGLQDIDLEDWKANTKYEGEAMSATGNQQVQWIWAVVEGFSEERRAMLQFAMASPNVPVGGVGRLRQSATGTLHPFTLISELPGRTATNTLPRADACFNTLYLPAFKSLEQMRQRVKIAVGMGIGHFDENAVSIGPGRSGPAATRGGGDAGRRRRLPCGHRGRERRPGGDIRGEGRQRGDPRQQKQQQLQQQEHQQWRQLG